MFGFGKSKEFDKDFDYDSVVSRYEGEVAVGAYVAETLNRAELNALGNQYHLMVPDGLGKMTYLLHGEIIEEYEGRFEDGKYHGEGRLLWRGEVFEGMFEDGQFLGD